MTTMKRAKAYTAIIAAVLSTIVPLFSFAQQPLIIVNGRTTELTDLKAIDPQDIESVETEPADEESVEKYGPRANNGIVRVTLRYDEPARFTVADASFADYIASHVKWTDNDPAARVSLRYTIGEDGCITVGEVLESTDNRLKRRILQAMDEAAKNPLWQPARRDGRPVATERVLTLQLPEGKSMPREPYIILL